MATHAGWTQDQSAQAPYPPTGSGNELPEQSPFDFSGGASGWDAQPVAPGGAAAAGAAAAASIAQQVGADPYAAQQAAAGYMDPHAQANQAYAAQMGGMTFVGPPYPPSSQPAALHGGRRFVGSVKSFSVANGYGFVASPEVSTAFGRNVYINQIELDKMTGVSKSQIACGTIVSFTVVLNKKGQPQAREVCVENTVAAQSQMAAIQANLQTGYAVSSFQDFNTVGQHYDFNQGVPGTHPGAEAQLGQDQMDHLSKFLGGSGSRSRSRSPRRQFSKWD